MPVPLRLQVPLQDLNYAYDPAGNLTRIEDRAQQTVLFRNQVVTPDCDYTYDAAYRLICATGANTSASSRSRRPAGMTSSVSSCSTRKTATPCAAIWSATSTTRSATS